MASIGDHILLVENDPEISDIIARHALKSFGYQVDAVTDSSPAVERSLQTLPNLILSDLNILMFDALAVQGVNTPLPFIAG